jgi:hypothetical protein
MDCGRYSAGVLHSVSDQIQNLQNCFTTPNKMTSKDDIKGLVSLKLLRPWEGFAVSPPPLLSSPPPVQETGFSCQTRVSALPSSSIKMAAVSSCLSQPEKPATHVSSSFMAFNKLFCSFWLILMIKSDQVLERTN